MYMYCAWVAPVREGRDLLSRIRLMALLRFGMGGLLSSGVALTTTAVLHELGFLSARAAAAVGLAAALIVNFLVLRYFVFRGTRSSFWRQLFLFLGSSGVFRGLEYLGFLLVSVVLELHYLLALVVVLGVSFLLKFVVYEGWVFVRSTERDIDHQSERHDAP